VPFLDVTEVLADPLIAAQKFVVVRRLQQVNQYGERTNTVQRFTAFGSVTPTGNNSLTRDAAFQVAGKTVQVVTKFKLRMGSKDNNVVYDPDLVLWRGDYFIINSVDDYSEFGVGMIVAEGASIDYVDQAPMQPVNPL